jgi:hypothetical protein
VKFPIDKQAHFWWGWAIAATLYPIGVWFAVLTAALVGAGKEVWDKRGHGTPDPKDFAATALGGAVGGLCCVVLKSISGWF